MKRFHFSLRPVGVLRSHAEMMAREEFAASLRSVGQAEAVVAGLQEQLRQIESRLTERRIDGQRAGEAGSQFHAYRLESAARDEAAAKLRDARAAMNTSREKYIEAQRAMKVLERLEARARLAHRKQAQREDQAAIDEIAGRRAQQSPLST